VAIRLTPKGQNFWVEVTPPHAETWRSDAPLSATDVLEVLSDKGCHSTDITDALYEADPTWTARHDAEVLRRRQP
jgi:hypothetical protein